MLDEEKKLDKRLVIYAGEKMYSSQGGEEETSVRKRQPKREWLEYRNSAWDMKLIKKRLGVEVIVEDTKDLSKKALAVDEKSASALAENWLEQARGLEGDPRELLIETARWYLALREDLEDKGAAGFTTICSSIEHRYGCNPCFAFMMLANQGYGFSCGIDINGLLTELILARAEPGAMFQGNLELKNLPKVSIHHCMAPYAMDSEGEFNVRFAHSKPERRGLVSAIRFKKGPVTLARLDSSLDFIHVSPGELVDYVNHLDRCINEAVIEIPSPEDFDRKRIKPRPPSKLVHYVMKYGDSVDAACEVAGELGIECLTS